MLGAIVGDIIGSVYERHNIKTKEFPLFRKDCHFTDDTVMTCAVAEAVMKGGNKDDFIDAMKKYGRMYPKAGYGRRFGKWLLSDDREPLGSYGNGSAMRVSPCAWNMDCGFMARTGCWPTNGSAIARLSAEVTHNHQEGIIGAMATTDATQLWDTARFLADRRKGTGHFIFTGSAVPADSSKISHTGTGRFAWITMRPMSLWESEESNGSVSLDGLFGGQFKASTAPDPSLEEVAYMLCRGGWPASIDMNRQAALKQSKNYVDAVCKRDISRVDNVKRDASFALRLMRSYARNQGGQVPISVMYSDLSSNKDDSLSEETISSYITALRKIFVIEDMPAWNPNLRSKTAIRTSDTRYFVDPSIATAALGVGPKDLMNDLNTFGLLFETMAIRDLRTYAEALDGEVFHYRDKNGLECDAVVHLRNGNYGLIEIKLGGETLIEEGAANLKKLADKIDTTKMNAPSFLMVLTAVGAYAYQRKDGVLVVPIECLKD